MSSSVEGKGKILAEISRLDYVRFYINLFMCYSYFKELALIKIDTKRLLESDERLEKLVCNLDERLVKLSDQTDQKFDAANETSSNRFAGTMTAGFVGVYAMFWGFILLK